MRRLETELVTFDYHHTFGDYLDGETVTEATFTLKFLVAAFGRSADADFRECVCKTATYTTEATDDVETNHDKLLSLAMRFTALVQTDDDLATELLGLAVENSGFDAELDSLSYGR